MAGAATFAQRLDVFIDRTLSPAEQSARLATTARKRVFDLIQSGRASPSYRRFVDGVEGATEWQVKPADGGNIVYRFQTLPAVIAFALGFLVQRSPSRSGLYRKSFYLGLSTSRDGDGGRFVRLQDFRADKLGADVVEVVIGNTQPYSRKVDVQLVGGRKLSFSVPPGLFDNAVAALKARFGAIVEVKRVYTLNFPGQYVLRREQFRWSGKRAGTALGRAGKRVESPAIVITLRR